MRGGFRRLTFAQYKTQCTRFVLGGKTETDMRTAGGLGPHGEGEKGGPKARGE